MSEAEPNSQAPSVTEGGETVAAVLLAAGAASRMGRPKALLPWGGVPLVRHLATVANASCGAGVWVVAGERTEEIRHALEGLACEVVGHTGWQSGQGSSLAAGIRALPPRVEAAIVLLCDQPFVRPRQLDSLNALYIEGRDMAACRYGDVGGPPALFARRHFRRLEGLRGDSGAKALLRDAGEGLACIDFPEGAIDLDSAEDYDRALARWATRKPDAP